MSKRSNKSTLEDRITVFYRGPKKNRDEHLARSIITLYMIGLGHTPIQRILAIHNNKWIDAIITQHFLGRKSFTVSGYGEAELDCPSKKTLSQADIMKVKEIASDYGTLKDEYVQHLVTTGTWKHERVITQKMCPNCHTPWDENSDVCPKCGRKRIFVRAKKIFNVDKISESDT